jgi:capsular polysaccharide biosynthesis protein
MNERPDDEIDFFEFLQSLWDGKWLISIFVAISVLLGGVFAFFSDIEYESKLTTEIYNTPPFIDNNKVFADFEKNFYLKRNFVDWKKNVGKSSLVFEDFSNTKVVNGFNIKKSELEQLATINTLKKSGNLTIVSLIRVNSNQLPVLEDFFKYANFINQLLKKEYVNRAQDEIKIIDSRMKVLPSSEVDFVNLFLSLNRFVVSAKKGSEILSIQNPTFPKKISPPYLLVFFFSVVLGLMVGICSVLIRSTIKKRKERLVKA